MLHDLSTRNFPGSMLERAMRRRDALGLAVLVALGLTLNNAGRHLVDAAKEEANTQDAIGSGWKVVRVARK